MPGPAADFEMSLELPANKRMKRDGPESPASGAENPEVNQVTTVLHPFRQIVLHNLNFKAG